MGSYIQDTLLSDEKVIYQGKVSVWSLTPHIILGFLTILVLGAWPALLVGRGHTVCHH